MSQIKIRDYQEECLKALNDVVSEGKKRALVVMASGLGKTLTSAFALAQFFTEHEFGRILILCHSEAILSQSKEKYKEYFGDEYSYGMYTGAEKTTRQTDFLFATFQTMKEHRKEFDKGAFSYIVVDEAHHSHARTYFPTIRYFEPDFLLGLTATPDRLDGQNIEEIYGAPVYELDYVAATQRGLTCPCDYQLVLDDISQEKLDEYLNSNEKMSIAQLNRTIFVPKRDEEIVRLIRKYSAEQQDPKTLIFCKTIEHACKIAKIMGDDVALVHNRQSRLANDAALEAFRQGKVRTILSIQMLNEGIDVPDANVLAFLRDSWSKNVFFQQLGRGTRLFPGKEIVKVLDFVGNCERLQMTLELEQDINGYRGKISNTEYPHGAGDADSREKFTLNIATPEFRSRRVDIVELLGRAEFKWTRDGVIEALQKASVDGFMPSFNELDSDPSLPNRSTIRHFFRNQREAAIASNLKIKTTYNVIDSDEEILNRFYQYAVSLGRWPSVVEIDSNSDMPCMDTYRNRIGSLTSLCRLCAQKYDCSMIKDSQRWIEWSRDQVIENFKRLIREKGRKPTAKDIESCQYLPTFSVCRWSTRCNSIKGLYELCHGDEILGVVKETELPLLLDMSVINKLGDIVRANGRKLASRDLKISNGSPISYAVLRRKGWSMDDFNRLIGADSILAELEATN